MNQANAMTVLDKARAAAGFLFRPTIGTPTRSPLLVRLAVGGVFLCSGVVKFLFENQGPVRFARIGFPHATELSYFVGATEVVCGALVILGLLVRLAALPLAIDMVVAIVSTKLPLLYGIGPEPVSAMPKTGWWAFAYQARLDVSMLAGCGYLLFAGAGLWSLDALLSRRRMAAELLSDRRVADATPLPSVLVERARSSSGDAVLR